MAWDGVAPLLWRDLSVPSGSLPLVAYSPPRGGWAPARPIGPKRVRSKTTKAGAEGLRYTSGRRTRAIPPPPQQQSF
eukprot:5335098-Pyramimonas_sp.AAC.1